MNNNILFADEKTILGLWANYALADVGVDESVVVFNPDGTGFIHYNQVNFDIIETFKWSMERTDLSIKGIKMFNVNNDVLERVSQSTIDVTNIKVYFTKVKPIHEFGSETIQFTEALDWTCDENDVFGLLYKVSDKGYVKYLKSISRRIDGR